MKRTKRILKILAVNGILLAVGMVVLELIFGGWLDTRKLNRLRLLRDCELQYDASGLYDDPNPVITYSRDRYGLRGTHAAPRDIDILTLGGSTTDQRYIRDGETWQDVLQQQFEQAGTPLVIGNAGVDGQSTFGQVLNFERWFPHIRGLAPEYILLYLGTNDFHRDADDDYDFLLREDQGFSLKQCLYDNSALAHLFRTLRGMHQAVVIEKIGHRRIDFATRQLTGQALRNDYGFMKPRLDGYAFRLRLVADRTRDLDAIPIFVSEPSYWYRITPHGIEGDATVREFDGHPFNGVDYCHMIRRLHEVTKAVAAEKGAFFIDLAERTEWTAGDFYDFHHMTPQGARNVGVFLYKELEPILKRRTARQ